MGVKTWLLATSLGLASVSNAKVNDFNAMIRENLSQQNTLRENINQQINNNQQVQVVESNSKTKNTLEVSNEISAYNPRTPKDMLTYKKERSQFRASNQKQQDRLADEIKESDMEF